ncbi:TolB family protein [Geodermatophilus sp. SYSU D01119]
MTVEIATATTARRVTADLADARRPPEFEELAATVAATRPRVRPAPPPPPPLPSRPAAPTTVTGPAVRPPADLPPPRPVEVPTPRPAATRRTARWAVAGVAALVLAGAGGAAWLLGRDDPAGGDGAAASTGTTAASTAGTTDAAADGPVAALAALPRSAPLPDGAVLVSRELDGEVDLLAVDTATGAAAPLTTAAGADVGAVVSPDRRTVVYGNVTDAGGELRAVAADGSGDRALFAEPLEGCADPGRPAWDPADPTRLALTCAGSDGVSLHLVTLDGAVGPALATAPALGDPAFSPDGTTVVYWAGQDPERDGGSLFAVAAAGGDSEPLTDEEDGTDADPSFSPDGRTLAFRREIVGGQRGIVTMAADGSGPRFVTSGSFDQDPVWSPRGDALAYKSDRAGDAAPPGDQLWVVDPDGLDRRQVPAEEGSLVNAVAWGPPAG